MFGNLAFKIDLKDKTKTSANGHQYYLEGAPGVAGEPRIDPVLALATYLLVRGESDGYLFVQFKEADGGRYEMRPDVRINDALFLDDLRVAFRDAGVDTYRFFGTHSFKRGGVQVFKALGVPDHEIKARGLWESDAAFFAYLPTANRVDHRHQYATPYAAVLDIMSAGCTIDSELIRMLLD